jgi:hypothetical protein
LVGPQELCEIKEEAIVLEQDLADWQKSRCPEFNPRTVGKIPQECTGSIADMGHWPGTVDSYFDLYVAGVWNTSRTARLLLISLILKLSKLLNDNKDHTCEHENALHLASDLLASIPYHLADDLQGFLHNKSTSQDTIEPGRAVGGLLLMHPLYVASTLLIVPPQMREYMRACLAWIGTNMGIGQASIFAKVSLVCLC